MAVVQSVEIVLVRSMGTV